MYGHSREVRSFSMLKGTARDQLESICVKIVVRTRRSEAVGQLLKKKKKTKSAICRNPESHLRGTLTIL